MLTFYFAIGVPPIGILALAMSKTTRFTDPRSPIHRNSDALMSLTSPHPCHLVRISNFAISRILMSMVLGLSFPRILNQYAIYPLTDSCGPRSFSYRNIVFRDIVIPDAMFPLYPGLPDCRTPSSSHLPTRVPNDGQLRSNLGLRQMKKSKPLTPMKPDDQISDRATNRYVSYLRSMAMIPSRFRDSKGLKFLTSEFPMPQYPDAFPDFLLC
jgi:hypothetical protein